MNSIRVGFIGTGNMGKAIMKAVAMAGDIPAAAIRAYDIDRVKARDFCETIGSYCAESAAEVVDACELVFLCVKPSAVEASLYEFKDVWNAEKVLITIAVGVPISYYESILGEDARIIRTMPNTPAMIGEGMTLYCTNACVPEESLDLAKSILSCMGRVESLEESLMAEVTALTGSSPAYVYMMIEAMADAAVLSGIRRDLAYKLAAQAVLGSAGMILETGEHPGKLKDQVCSPGGTTIEAVRVLEMSGFRSALIEAMQACTEKARRIADAFKKDHA